MKKMFNKKFFLILGSAITLLIVLSIGMILLTKENAKTFSKEGYIITSGKEDTAKYYFEEGTTYKKNINSQLVFTDKNGDKVAVETNNFMHYTDGGIKFLKNGVIMDLNSINNSTVPYYNITDKSVLEYSKKSYFIETIDKTLGFNNIAGRISENKYIFAGVNVKLQLAGNENIIEGDYFEVNYIEDGIIRVENHDASYQTTAEGSYILVDNIIRIDLGNKKIYYNDEEKMSLSQMTIDGNENIEIVPEEEDKGTGEGEGDGSGDGTGENETPGTDEQPGTDAPDTETPGINEPGTEDPGTEQPGEDEPGVGEGDGSGEGTGTGTGNKRSATIEMTRGSVTSNSLSASFVVNDPDKAIEGKLSWRIINADTGNEVEKITEDENISFRPEFDMGYSSLSPDTNYILTITETTNKGKEIQYFQKLFRTEKLGIKLEKKYATQDSLAFELLYDEESEVKSATITIYQKIIEEKNGVKEIIFKQIDQEVVTKDVPPAVFQDLKANTEYEIEVSNIIMNSTEWQDTYKINETAKTLKTPPYLKDLTVEVNDENSIFTLGVDTVIDDHKSITKYTYYIYKEEDIKPENMDNLKPVHTVTKYDSDDINIKIDGNPIKGKTDYKFKIVAEYFDNEKYGEFETIFSKNFILAGKPSIEFEQDYDRTTINTIAGKLKLTDVSCTVPLKGRPCFSRPNDAYVEFEIPNYADEARQQKIEFNPQTLEADMEVTGLLAGYDYSFKVWADVDLFDGKGLQKTLLGEFIAGTKDMDALDFIWTKNPSKIEDLINLNLKIISPESNPILGDSLYNMTVNLYSGNKAGELQNGSILTPLKSVKLSGDAVKAFYLDKSVINTLNTFGITEKVEEIYDEETGELIETITTPALEVLKSLTDGKLSKNYTIEITDLYDETETNRFTPIPGKNYYTFEVDNEFIIEQEMENPTIIVEPITNEMLNGLDKDDILVEKIGKYNNLLSDTAIVGYKVDSITDLGKMQSEYHLNLKELIYYVCDADQKSGCTIDETTIVERIDLTETNDTTMYFKVGNGTKFSAPDLGLARGHNYIFKLKISHEKSENNQTVLKYYPSVDVKSQTMKTPKDTPSYRMYIENTTEDKANYMFEYRDIDNALFEDIIYYTVDDELKNTLNKPEEPETPEGEIPEGEEGIIEPEDPEATEEETPPDEPVEEEQPEVPVEPEKPKELEIKEAKLNGCKKDSSGFTVCRYELEALSNDSVYNVSFKRALIKKSNAVENVKIGEYIFDGKLVYDKDTIKYENATSENDNRLRIIIDKEATSERYVNRISAYHVTLSADGVEDYEKVFASNKVSTCTEGETAYKCLIVDYADIKEFKKKNITVKVLAYYDNGIVDNIFTASNSNVASKLNNEAGYIIQENNYFNKQFKRAKYLNFSMNKNALKIGTTSNPIGNYFFDYASNSNIKIYKGINEDAYSFNEEKDIFAIQYMNKFNDAFRIKENSNSKELYQVNNKQLSISELGTDKNNFKFNSIIPKITVTTKGLVNGSTVTIKANGVDEEILKDEFKEEKGKYYYYINIYKDEEKTEKINAEPIKAEIDLENGTVIEFTKYLPDTTYYFEVYAYLLKEKDYKITQLFDGSKINDYVTKLYTFSSLSPKEILSYGNPKISYTSKTVDEQYLKRMLEIYVDTKNIGTYKTRFELHDINENKVLEKVIEPKLQSGYYRSITQEDITPTEESIASGLDYVFGAGHYKLLMYVETEVEVSEEHPEGQAELLVYESDITLKKLQEPTYTVTRSATTNTLTFNVTISDTDKVIKEGKYCVELLDAGTNPLQGTQYKKCDLSVLELNKKIEFTGLKSETLYIFRVSSDIYTNNVDEPKVQRSIIRDTVASTSTSYGMALGSVGANNQGTNAIVLTFNGGYMVNEKVKAITYTITETVTGQSTSNKIASGNYIIGKDKNFIKNGLNYQLVIDPEGLKLTKKNEYFVDITYWLDANMTTSFNDKSYPYTVTFND